MGSGHPSQIIRLRNSSWLLIGLYVLFRNRVEEVSLDGHEDRKTISHPMSHDQLALTKEWPLILDSGPLPTLFQTV